MLIPAVGACVILNVDTCHMAICVNQLAAELIQSVMTDPAASKALVSMLAKLNLVESTLHAKQ